MAQAGHKDWVDPYGADVLAHDPHPQGPASRPVAAEPGLVVEDVASGWVGAVTRVEKSGGVYVVELEDRHGRRRSFRLGPGFWIDGRPVTLTPPAGPPAPVRRTTASGSVAAPRRRARVARASRILVEGKHDAELVQKVWGEDLADVGVVVEMLDGVDHLPEAVVVFGPGEGRRLGVLVDHLVPGSKESRIAAAVQAGPGGDSVHVVGHPYIDIWEAVKPARLGLARWPEVPRGEEWKRGLLARIGWPHRTDADVADGWRRILAAVRDYRDLEPALLGRVEELIDFVTAA
jgi:hypothetical protein